MHWTATHRFTFLAMHLSLADGEVQDAEREAFVDAAQRIGLASGLDRGRVTQMVYDACDAFFDTEDKRPEVVDTIERLGAAFGTGSPVLAALLAYLVDVAKAHDGIVPAEAHWLEQVAEIWGV